MTARLSMSAVGNGWGRNVQVKSDECNDATAVVDVVVSYINDGH